MREIVIDGRLTADPIIKETKAGKVASFSLANNDSKDGTEYYNVTAWGNVADIVEKNFIKGFKIVASGSFKKERFTNQEGKVKETFVITARSFSFTPRVPSAEGGEEQ